MQVLENTTAVIQDLVAGLQEFWRVGDGEHSAVVIVVQEVGAGWQSRPKILVKISPQNRTL